MGEINIDGNAESVRRGSSSTETKKGRSAMPFDEEELDPHGECAAEIKRLQEALRRIANCGQTEKPDHWEFRVWAREVARAALNQ